MTEKRLYRISEIEQITGVPRRRIHFYIQSELLHKPLKTGRTMAYYDQSHIKRLEVISRAREQGEPLLSVKEKVRGIVPQEALRVSDYYYSHSSADQDAFLPASAVSPVSGRSGCRRDSEKTRERILAAGCDMFRKKGFSNTRINDLTRFLDIGKGTFYFYFRDKKALFLECVPRLFEEMFSVGWDKIRKVYNPVERLEIRFDLVIPSLKEFCSILQLAKEAMADEDPKLKELGEKTYLSIRRPLESDIEKGIKQGIFMPVNAGMAAALMIAMVENLYYVNIMSGDMSPADMKVNLFNLLAFGLVGAGERMAAGDAD